ncbi:MAG: EamA family transporter [Xanthobacteraceae bacterium]
MATLPWLWAVITLIAGAAQTVRNAAQRQLTGELGTVGATHVRFLFGLPFALVFLGMIVLGLGSALPRPGFAYFVWASAGALAQIVATAMMLAAMGERSFVVTIAYTKTEPVQVALFGLVFLGDRLTVPMLVAILVATGGVMVMSLRPEHFPAKWTPVRRGGGVRPTLLGLLAGSFFALSAVGIRGAIIDLAVADHLLAASFTLCVVLALQAIALSLYLLVRDCAVLVAIVRAWRRSLLAGFMGAFASQCWFLAFALTTAANVRTLALVEVLYAQAVSRYAFGQRTTPREALGLVLIVAGVALLLALQ